MQTHHNLIQDPYKLDCFFQHCTHSNMEGPSPLMPSLILLVLGILIYGSSMLSLFDMSLSFYQMASEAEEKSFTTLVLVLLVLLVFVLIYFPYSFSLFSKSSYGTKRYVNVSSHDYDESGFGLGTLLLVLLFILLYNLL